MTQRHKAYSIKKDFQDLNLHLAKIITNNGSYHFYYEKVKKVTRKLGKKPVGNAFKKGS